MPACAPLHVHVVGVHTAILTQCILYLSLAGMPEAIICNLCYLVAELLTPSGLFSGQFKQTEFGIIIVSLTCKNIRNKKITNSKDSS